MNTKLFFMRLLQIIVGLLAIFLIAIGAFIGINLNDQPPSAAAIEFQQAWDNRGLVNERDNGYLYMLGFDATTELDPQVVGTERALWIKEKTRLNVIGSSEFPGKKVDFEKHLPKKITQVMNDCVEVNEKCIAAINTAKAEINSWSGTDSLLLKRYLRLIAYSAWREEVGTVNLPFINYIGPIKAQRLLFLNTFAIQQSSSLNIQKMLDDDLRFWRTVLREADMLITKMIAIAAIKNNFLWTNQLLLDSYNKSIPMPIPQVIQQPFISAELSLQRSLIGEWVFGNSSALQLDEHAETQAERYATKFLLKKQDSSNRLAERLNSLVHQLDVPVTEFESVWLAQQQKRPQNTMTPAALYYLLHPYNPVGQILVDVASPAYESYFASVKDLEAFRLGLLSAIEKRHNPSGQKLKMRSPYTNKPFVVDEAQRSITVTGYGSGRNAQQVYFY